MEDGIHTQTEGAAANPQELSSTRAKTSMILGIASVPTSCIGVGILLGIAAIVSGIIALFQIRKGQAQGKGMAIAGICAGVIGLVVPVVLFFIMLFSGMALPFLEIANENARQTSCASNLKQIGMALKQYSMDYIDCYPNANGAAGLEMLRANGYITNPDVFVCPSSTRETPAKPGQPLTEANVSYFYFGGRTERSSPDAPIACDRLGNHKEFGSILFVDGHVQSYTGQKWYEKGGIR